MREITFSPEAETLTVRYFSNDDEVSILLSYHVRQRWAELTTGRRQRAQSTTKGCSWCFVKYLTIDLGTVRHFDKCYGLRP